MYIDICIYIFFRVIGESQALTYLAKHELIIQKRMYLGTYVDITLSGTRSSNEYVCKTVLQSALIRWS